MFVFIAKLGTERSSAIWFCHSSCWHDKVFTEFKSLLLHFSLVLAGKCVLFLARLHSAVFGVSIASCLPFSCCNINVA